MQYHRAAITWAVLTGLVAAAFVVTVILLNATLFSAAGFAGSYLAALSRHDVSAALELAGPATIGAPAKAGKNLLDPRALAELRDIHLVSDIDQGGGVHLVRYGYTMAPTTGTTTTAGTTLFEVKRDGTRMGLFSGWSFAKSPRGTLAITPNHDAGFTVNGLELNSSAPNVATLQQVFAPGLYVLGNDSTLFTATPVFVKISKIDAVTKASIDIQANPSFISQIQNGLDGQLKKCTTQKVLLPTGCPFGKEIGDRIEGTPTWSIVHSPTVTIVPGATPGSWQVPRAHGTAHLVVQVRSIFDGSLRTLNEDVPFDVSYTISFRANGQLLITGQ